MFCFVAWILFFVCLSQRCHLKKVKASLPLRNYEEAWKRVCDIVGFNNPTPTADELGAALMYKARDILRLEEQVAVTKRQGQWENAEMHTLLGVLIGKSKSLDEALEFLNSVGVEVLRGDLFRAAARKS